MHDKYNNVQPEYTMIFLVSPKRKRNLMYFEYGIEHNPNAESWTFLENSIHLNKSNLFDVQMIKEVTEPTLLLSFAYLRKSIIERE